MLVHVYMSLLWHSGLESIHWAKFKMLITKNCSCKFDTECEKTLFNPWTFSFIHSPFSICLKPWPCILDKCKFNMCFLNLLKHDVPSFCKYFPVVVSVRNLLVILQGGVMATHDEETRKFFKHSSVICVLSPRYASNKLSIFKQQASSGQEFMVHFLCMGYIYGSFG